MFLLAVAHYRGDPSWISQNLLGVPGGDGILWQVQTTFLSVGFAGLAIAAQLFAEAPLAIGASRGRVLEYIKAGWFVGVGLVANAAIGIETIWFPSGLGLLGVAILGFTPTVVMLVVSTAKLMELFGHPSLLDEVVRVSLVETLSTRLSDVARKYGDAKKQMDGLSAADWAGGRPKAASATLRVPVPEAGRVVKTIRPKVVRQAIDLLGLRATDGNLTSGTPTQMVEPPRVTIDVEPGDRTRLGETAFRVVSSQPLDEATTIRTVRLLQSSIEFEPTGSVTPDEETGREIANLKDAIGTSLRSGALATAERALELLGHVVRGVWLSEPEMLDSTRRASITRRDWLFGSVGEVEQDSLLSPRVAGIFISAAMNRALEAPRVGSTEYVDECLRSFTRLWSDLLLHGGHEFEPLPSRITTCVHNLASYSYSASDERENLQARGTWAMVELVKLALDAKKPDAAKMAAKELSGLFEFSRDETGRSHVRGGQLVLTGWLDYLAYKKDQRDPADPELRALVTPRGNWAEIISARSLAERGAAPFSRWDWWEMEMTTSRHAQILELSSFIDRAQLVALSSSYGTLPPASDQETASEYKRFLSMLKEGNKNLTEKGERLKQTLFQEVSRWDAEENDRLALEPLSAARLGELRTAVYETLAERPQLAAQIPLSQVVPDTADTSRPILGMNLRVPRRYLVDKMFNRMYADPKELGRIIAQGFEEGEKRKIIDRLRAMQDDVLQPTALEIRRQIESLGDEAKNYVLLTPYGGLEDVQDWYSSEFRDALKRVLHIESGVLDGEAVLFDRRTTLAISRRPEKKEGLRPVPGTFIALGTFDDVHSGDEPQVRIETGEHFVVWPGEAPRLFRFGTEPVSS